MRGKRLAALLMSGIMAASVMTGCGELDKNAVVATMDGKEITLGIANFTTRLEQVAYDDMYAGYSIGDDLWRVDLYGTGSTFEDDLKARMIEQVRIMYTVQDHMDEYGVELTEMDLNRINTAASGFLSTNSDEALAYLGAEQEIVDEYLRLMTIENKVFKAVTAQTDIVVTDEEAQTSSYSFVRKEKDNYMNEEGETVDHTEESLQELRDTLNAFAADAREGDMKEVAAQEEYDYTVYRGTFTQEDEDLSATLLEALKGLEEGEISDVVETDSTMYILRLDKKFDVDATEAQKELMKADKEEEYFWELVDSWMAEQEWKLNESVWDTVKFNNLFTTDETKATN